jgi:hypothetical protein
MWPITVQCKLSNSIVNVQSSFLFRLKEIFNNSNYKKNFSVGGSIPNTLRTIRVKKLLFNQSKYFSVTFSGYFDSPTPPFWWVVLDRINLVEYWKKNRWTVYIKRLPMHTQQRVSSWQQMMPGKSYYCRIKHFIFSLSLLLRSMITNLGAANSFTIDYLNDLQNWLYVEQAKILYVSVRIFGMQRNNTIEILLGFLS